MKIQILKLKCRKSIENIAIVKRNKVADSYTHLNDNDIITFKIWLFDYKNFKMKTDEFPFKRQRSRREKKNKLCEKRNILKSYLSCEKSVEQ
jgi:hypothetical protein